jgi:hypothetical protein
VAVGHGSFHAEDVADLVDADNVGEAVDGQATIDLVECEDFQGDGADAAVVLRGRQGDDAFEPLASGGLQDACEVGEAAAHGAIGGGGDDPAEAVDRLTANGGRGHRDPVVADPCGHGLADLVDIGIGRDRRVDGQSDRQGEVSDGGGGVHAPNVRLQ